MTRLAGVVMPQIAEITLFENRPLSRLWVVQAVPSHLPPCCRVLQVFDLPTNRNQAQGQGRAEASAGVRKKHHI